MPRRAPSATAAVHGAHGVLLVKGSYGRTGGPETLLGMLVAGLDRARVRPALVILARPEDPPPAALGPAIPDCVRRDLPWRGVAGAPAVGRALGEIARDVGAGVIHTHDMRSNLAAWFLARRTRTPWIAHVHGWLGTTHRGRWRAYERIECRLIRRADLVLVGSTAALAEVEAGGVTRARVVPNAVAVPPDGAGAAQAVAVRAALGVADGTVVIGTAGRLHAGKGQRFLLEAVAALRRRGHAVHALVVGEGPDHDVLDRLAARLGIAAHVTLSGFRADLQAHVAAMDVFVAASLKESLPLTVLEAMALRRPVVASAVGDLPRVITDGESGFLVPPGDAGALAATLERLVADAVLRARAGTAGRAVVVARYSAGAMTHALEDIYAEVAARPPAATRRAAPEPS